MINSERAGVLYDNAVFKYRYEFIGREGVKGRSIIAILIACADVVRNMHEFIGICVKVSALFNPDPTICSIGISSPPRMFANDQPANGEHQQHGRREMDLKSLAGWRLSHRNQYTVPAQFSSKLKNSAA